MALLLFALLFGDSSLTNSPGLVGLILRESVAVFRNPETQWMVFVCLGSYFAAFLVLRARTFPAAGTARGDGRPSPRVDRATRRVHFGACGVTRPVFWLAGVLLVSAVVYARNYSPSSEALTLLGGAVVGQGLGLWVSRGRSLGRSSRGDEAHSKAGNPMEPRCLGGYDSGAVAMLVVLLCLASVWHPDTGRDFAYHGNARWSGPWDNPNLFGLLMAAGMVLAVGQGVQRLEAGGWRLEEDRNWKCKAREYGLAILCLVAAGVIGRGLLHSYSRGAWLAAFCGLAYLFWNLRRGSTLLTPTLFPRPSGGEGELLPRVSRIPRFPGNWLRILVILISVSVLCFWHFRRAEWRPARRAFSVANTADFSWRNRVAAWEGALQMMAERPWIGFGWNQPERVYDQYYRATKLDEGMAIQLNDYFILGTTLGLPALLCFAAYIGLALTGKAGECRRTLNLEPRSSNFERGGSQGGEAQVSHLAPPTLDFRLRALDSSAVCRAGAVVLLVGLWFDGGLFKLATGAAFWILLELGRQEPEPVRRV